MLLNRLVLRGTYSVLSRFQSTSEATTSVEVGSYLERRHTTPASYKEVNCPYINHPKSVEPSAHLSHDNEELVALLDNLKAVVMKDVATYPPDLAYRSAEVKGRDHDVVFLTEEEWQTAQENLIERHKHVLEQSAALLCERKAVNSEVTEDKALEWLFDSPVTFADSSKLSSNEDRYIVTRNTDGTLYHNDHNARDTLNNRFFRPPDRLYPPADMFEEDEFFMSCITKVSMDPIIILEQLYNSYPTDHPTFILRHGQLAGVIFNKPELIMNTISSRFFVDIVHRAVLENFSMLKVIDFLTDKNRSKLVFGLERLADYQRRVDKSDFVKNSDQNRLKRNKKQNNMKHENNRDDTQHGERKFKRGTSQYKYDMDRKTEHPSRKTGYPNRTTEHTNRKTGHPNRKTRQFYGNSPLTTTNSSPEKTYRKPINTDREHWICKFCNIDNFARNTKCFKCNELRINCEKK